MKLFKIIIGLALLSIVACNNEKPKKASTNKKEITKVQHYICDKKCENSGGEVAGNCPTCKTPYTHNVAYHANDLLKTGPIKVQSNATQPTSTNNNAPKPPSPAQNLAGVYHYTCTNGCNGGAGSAASCKTCGEALAHNTAYHN
jgi:hypothetical protein